MRLILLDAKAIRRYKNVSTMVWVLTIFALLMALLLLRGSSLFSLLAVMLALMLVGASIGYWFKLKSDQHRSMGYLILETDAISLENRTNRQQHRWLLNDLTTIEIHGDGAYTRDHVIDMEDHLAGRDGMSWIKFNTETGSTMKFDFVLDSYYRYNQLLKHLEGWKAQHAHLKIGC